MSLDEIKDNDTNEDLANILPSSGRILFVDDEDNILRSLRRLFLEEDYEVFTASSGAEGLAILEKESNIGLIVSDQRMPKMTGVDFLEQSKTIAPNAIRILLTGYADVTAAVDAINRGGAARYVSKPWQDEELVLIVKECMQRYYLINENKRLQEEIRQKNAELKKWNDELQMLVQEQTMELQDKYNEVKNLNFRLRENFKDTIAAFSALLEMRDPGMRSHARNVSKLSGLVARLLNAPPAEVEVIMVAAMMHDVGKVGMSDIVLRADHTAMSPEAKVEYEKHPIRGQETLDILSDMQRHGLIIRHHHERYDGLGFPDKLKKQDIPIGARIIAIADFIDKSLRNYEGDSGLEQVLKKVGEESGRMFDPKLVPHFDKPARDFYKKVLPKADYVELQLLPKDLQVGMLLARDITSGTGLLLLSKGTELNQTNIQVLKRYHELDPSKRPIAVLSKR